MKKIKYLIFILLMVVANTAYVKAFEKDNSGCIISYDMFRDKPVLIDSENYYFLKCNKDNLQEKLNNNEIMASDLNLDKNDLTKFSKKLYDMIYETLDNYFSLYSGDDELINVLNVMINPGKSNKDFSVVINFANTNDEGFTSPDPKYSISKMQLNVVDGEYLEYDKDKTSNNKYAYQIQYAFFRNILNRVTNEYFEEDYPICSQAYSNEDNSYEKNGFYLTNDDSSDQYYFKINLNKITVNTATDIYRYCKYINNLPLSIDSKSKYSCDYYECSFFLDNKEFHMAFDKDTKEIYLEKKEGTLDIFDLTDKAAINMLVKNYQEVNNLPDSFYEAYLNAYSAGFTLKDNRMGLSDNNKIFKIKILDEVIIPSIKKKDNNINSMSEVIIIGACVLILFTSILFILKKSKENKEEK